MADITVVGSFVTDTVVRVKEFPRPGQTVLGESVRSYPGGKGLNQCIAAARLGGAAAMSGMLGTDGAGAALTALLKAEGVECGSVFFTDRAPTGAAQIQIDGAGENKIAVVPGANFEYGLRQLKEAEAAIASSKLVVAQFELSREVTEEILFTSRRLGVPMLLNPAPSRTISREALSCASYLTPNETELESLTGQRTDTREGLEQAAKTLLDAGVKTVIATLGSRGAMIADAGIIRFVPGFRVKAVDTVAAGDCFNGALACMLAAGKDLTEAVTFANAAGALAVTKPGAVPSLPYLSEVRSFLARHRPGE